MRFIAALVLAILTGIACQHQTSNPSAISGLIGLGLLTLILFIDSWSKKCHR
jgi:protein-S-isoprenylcysteine O-methyltransferase Ste14